MQTFEAKQAMGNPFSIANKLNQFLLCLRKVLQHSKIIRVISWGPAGQQKTFSWSFINNYKHAH